MSDKTIEAAHAIASTHTIRDVLATMAEKATQLATLAELLRDVADEIRDMAQHDMGLEINGLAADVAQAAILNKLKGAK